MSETNTESCVATVIDSDDEFGGDYEDPGSLRPEAVKDTVVYTLDWTVGTVVSQIDADPADPETQGVIVTAPPFQRRTAWGDDRQSLFIESLILGLPVPPLVLAESNRHEGQFFVIDGKQRLTALKMFFNKDQPLKLRGLELLSTEISGLTLDDMRTNGDTRRYVNSLLSQPIRTIVVRNWKTPPLLHLIFSRLNKASVPLASHELRQALHPGRFTNFINQASGESPELLRARRLSEPDFRLRDAETLLRFLSFKSNMDKYRGDLRDFLDRSIKGGNESHSTSIPASAELIREMSSAINATFSIFGEAAFLRYDPQKQKYMPRFNIAVFDTMTWYLSDPEIREDALRNKDSVRHSFETLCTDDQEFASFLTSTTKTRAATIGRLEKWGDALGQAIDRPLEWTSYATQVVPLVKPEI